MTTDANSPGQPLHALRADLEAEDKRAIKRAKIGIGIRGFLIVLAFVYMSWLLGALSKLDAPALTRIAVDSVEARLPELRANLQTYALDVAPELTDKAQGLFLEVPGHVRRTLEGRLFQATEGLVAQFEDEVEASLTQVVDYQAELMRAEMPDATPEEQLDILVLGVSAEFRDTMTEAVDLLYEDYSAEMRKLAAYLERLRTAESLNESERIDKELIEAWMVMVHKHRIVAPEQIARNLRGES